MGMYKSTYIGIYLELPYYKQETKVEFYKHPVTGKIMKSKFCPDTGVECIKSERIDISYEAPDAYIDVSSSNLLSSMFFAPAFCGAGSKTQTFILNSNTKYSYNHSGLFNFDISELNIDKLKEEFTIEYKDYLDYYTEQYGEYEICYGVVNYQH
jgi:hypothetical protein